MPMDRLVFPPLPAGSQAQQVAVEAPPKLCKDCVDHHADLSE